MDQLEGERERKAGEECRSVCVGDTFLISLFIEAHPLLLADEAARAMCLLRD